MSATPIRKCPDCAKPLRRVVLMDKAHLSRQTSLEYRALGAGRKSWTSEYPVEGQVSGYLCPECGRILLYGNSKRL
jgi:hypothetical protein